MLDHVFSPYTIKNVTKNKYIAIRKWISSEIGYINISIGIEYIFKSNKFLYSFLFFLLKMLKPKQIINISGKAFDIIEIGNFSLSNKVLYNILLSKCDIPFIA